MARVLLRVVVWNLKPRLVVSHHRRRGPVWSALLLPALAAVLCSSCSAQRLPLQDQQPPMGMDHQLFVDAFGEGAFG
jgi:hypothetical protein